MLTLVLVAAVAAAASLLTFFSGFGLGTLLLPVFALSAPVEAAVMMTALVHLANNGFKLALLGRHVHGRVAWRFGVPALLGAASGAWLLLRLSHLPPLGRYVAFGRRFEIDPAGLVVGALVVIFAFRELRSGPGKRGIGERWLPLGGLASGFFGGLSGHQGALRSAFLIGAGLGKEGFVATGVAIACGVDVARLMVYAPSWRSLVGDTPVPVVITAMLAAFAGALAGRALLHKITFALLHRVVGGLLLVAGVGLMVGAY